MHQPIRSRAGRWLCAGLLAGTLTARPALAHTALQGHVTDTGGSPIAGAWVYAYDTGINIIYGLTDDAGQYDLTVLPGTGWSVTALAPGYREATESDVIALADTHNHGPDLKLENAPPLPVVQAAAPIPLTEGIDSAAFADTPLIDIDKPYHVVIGLDKPNDWKGPQSVSGRFKVKWDGQGLYYAGEVTWEAPHLNSHQAEDLRNGNGIEFYIQTAPFDRGRTEYHPDQNWHLTVGDGATPSWWLFGTVNAPPNVEIGSHLLATDKPSGDGIFFRLNVPWSMLPKGNGASVAPPAEGSTGALGIALNAADPASDRSSTVRKFQLSWPMSDTNATDPSYLQPIVFVKATDPGGEQP